MKLLENRLRNSQPDERTHSDQREKALDDITLSKDALYCMKSWAPASFYT